MQKCKYLDDLGLEIIDYGTNIVSDNNRKQAYWAKQQYEYGFDERETWCLDKIFIEWIYTRVMMYKERACIDFSCHKIPYKNKEITQGEAILAILKYAKEILQNKDDDELMFKNSREICDLWKEVLPFMWW